MYSSSGMARHGTATNPKCPTTTENQYGKRGGGDSHKNQLDLRKCKGRCMATNPKNPRTIVKTKEKNIYTLNKSTRMDKIQKKRKEGGAGVEMYSIQCTREY
jgi:hypothetical protein